MDGELSEPDGGCQNLTLSYQSQDATDGSRSDGAPCVPLILEIKHSSDIKRSDLKI